jgi:FtsP/CotA-like multicopper oxidase with cupredoxin domain
MRLISEKLNRRRLMTTAGLLTVGAAATAAAPVKINVETAPKPVNAASGEVAMADMTTTPAASTPKKADEMTADEMDAMHEAGIKSFPAPTQGKGGQPLAFEMDGDVKVFKLTCATTQWEFLPGKTVEAMAYNGMVPGPEIRVTEGDKVRILVTNQLTQSTAVHFHGLMVPNNMDGVPFITQPPIKPGQTFTYEFQAREGNAGSHMYHSHHNSTEQVTKGLLGPFIIEPKDPSSRPAFDVEYTMVLNDGPIGGYSLNGKSFPATEPITAKKGQKLLIRYMNEGLMIHPMHLHGMPQLVIAHDGYLLPQPYRCDTLNIAPGQRTEVIVDCTEVGVWAFHCHILAHAEGPTGMFGMVTVLNVTE